MTETLASLRRKIAGAVDLDSVVRSMKALAASSITQYERSVLALADYYRNIEMGLLVCMRDQERSNRQQKSEFGSINKIATTVNVIVFGSDQGLVGQFNEQIAEFTLDAIKALPGQKRIWTVGERIHARIMEAGLLPAGLFAVPTSVNAITPLVGKILIESESYYDGEEIGQIHLFHNRPVSGAIYEPVGQQLLPLDKDFGHNLSRHPWPTPKLPEILGSREQTLRALVGEFLFVSLFKCCAESLASENANRLAAMQRAEKNIDELVSELNQSFRSMRQASIDEELFEVLSGFEALGGSH